MKPRIKLAESATPDGGTLALFEHDGNFSIFLDGKELMHSMVTASESLLGSLGAERLDPRKKNRVLIGGLGLGFTLKAVLESTGSNTTIEVAELLPAVIEWNRSHMQNLNGSLLDDPRVDVRNKDVAKLIREAAPATYDAILLDVDNGPVAMVAENNSSLYSRSGIKSICSALKPGGRFIIWSASPDQKFEHRLQRAGLKMEAVRAKAHARAKRASYLLYVIQLPPARS